MKPSEYELRLRKWKMRAEQAREKYSRFYWFPHILDLIDQVILLVRSENVEIEELRQTASGLFRVATDSIPFAESPLGDELLIIVNDLIRDAERGAGDKE